MTQILKIRGYAFMEIQDMSPSIMRLIKKIWSIGLKQNKVLKCIQTKREEANEK